VRTSTAAGVVAVTGDLRVDSLLAQMTLGDKLGLLTAVAAGTLPASQRLARPPGPPALRTAGREQAGREQAGREQAGRVSGHCGSREACRRGRRGCLSSR
jgi:hypothetical protein